MSPAKRPTAPAVGPDHATRYVEITERARCAAQSIVSTSRRDLGGLCGVFIGSPLLTAGRDAIPRLRRLLDELEAALPPAPR